MSKSVGDVADVVIAPALVADVIVVDENVLAPILMSDEAETTNESVIESRLTNERGLMTDEAVVTTRGHLVTERERDETRMMTVTSPIGRVEIMDEAEMKEAHITKGQGHQDETTTEASENDYK